MKIELYMFKNRALKNDNMKLHVNIDNICYYIIQFVGFYILEVAVVLKQLSFVQLSFFC